jgi:hypothetical protein
MLKYIWDAGNGACLRTLEVGQTIYNISFDTSGSYLLTDIDIISLDISSISNTTQAATALEKSKETCSGPELE